MNYIWKIGGEAGFGIMSIGLSMAKIATRSGYHIFDYSEYPSLIRGGHNTYEVHIADVPVHASKQEIDMLVCLNKETYTLHAHRLHAQSLILFDADVFTPKKGPGIFLSLPLKKILLENQTSAVMINTIALGASLYLLGGDLMLFEGLLREVFGKKGENVSRENMGLAEKGYEYAQKNYSDKKKDVLVKLSQKTPAMVIAGNEAFSIASLVADCRMFVAYPMTPASSVLTYCASVAEKTGTVVRHAEDEISVINTAIGSSCAGVRSSVATSGGGFALMTESLSFAGIAEIPIVIFLAQRPAPGTGMPTWTEQGDLLFAIHAGHGDFMKIVLAPGDPLEMMEMTLTAYDLADKYQTPVIVLSDKVLSESHQDISFQNWEHLVKSYKPNRGKIIDAWKQKEPYKRYQITEDGISPLLIPGVKGQYYQANSYEHREDSHTTEDMNERVAQADKRGRKIMSYLQTDFVPPVLFGEEDTADIIFVSWGGNKGVIQDAQKKLEEKGIKTAYLHFSYVYPLDQNTIAPFFKNKKRYILIENNQSGQFGQLLRQQTGIDITERLLKYSGQPIFVEDIVHYITSQTHG